MGAAAAATSGENTQARRESIGVRGGESPKPPRAHPKRIIHPQTVLGLG